MQSILNAGTHPLPPSPNQGLWGILQGTSNLHSIAVGFTRPSTLSALDFCPITSPTRGYKTKVQVHSQDWEVY